MRRATAAITAAVSMLAASPALANAPVGMSPQPLFHLGPAKPQPSLAFSYDGFSVDASRTPKGVSADKAVRQIKAQIDLVTHVGLKPEVVAFMRTVPVLADPAKPNAPGESARYVPGQGVMIRVSRLSPKKAVLLEGLLEAYHDQRLAPGQRADVTRFRTEAASRTPPVWPKTAMMLQSDSAFFALTSSAYLYGAITREPYTRKDLRQTQPRYYRWLADLYDQGRVRG
ncbi:hypothetical protein [Phenylobacterium montanum]|uniref:DUF2927 domain-containing protein n=1 Tax=Phenylobacterium montanum TaxID=2823693 RepID=A0A975FWS2_9CAUL|nr:hypothetical protein [Caulobacter sp. S6]QUD86840.1 hypothetical protein KCG34_17405 [Caulobacter sp. S6]